MNLVKNLKKMTRMQMCLAVLVLVAVVAGGVMLMKRNEGFNNESKQPVVVYFFYVDWCPHCTTAKPEVAAFEEELAAQNNLINDTPIEVRQVNCEEEAELAKEFDVKAYPTVIAVNNNKKEVLNDKVTSSNLIDWLSNLVN